MTTKEYVKKYRLDKAEFANHFNTDLFLQDLNEEFLARIEKEKTHRKKEGLEYSFRIFQSIIQEMQTKFCAISNKKSCGPLRPELWNAFYAKYIIPVRERDFPDEHAQIQAKREAYEKKVIREQVIDSFGREEYSYYRAMAKAVGYAENSFYTKKFFELREKIDLEVEKRYKADQEKLNKKLFNKKFMK